MSKMDLVCLFDMLATPEQHGNDRVYAAAPILGQQRYRIGRDSSGSPALLITVQDPTARSTQPPIGLQHLQVAYSLDCLISRADGSSEFGRFTVIRCVDADRDLQLYFLRVLGAVLPSLGQSPSSREIGHAIDHLVELFQAISQPTLKTVQGLWAELFLISESHDPGLLIDAWHCVPEDLYDFNAGRQRMEVKSTRAQVRKHHFTLTQLHPPEDTILVIASLFVERAGGGTSVLDLIQEIHTGIRGQPKALIRVERIVALSLGNSWRQASAERFDKQLARQSLAFFNPASIPSIGPNLPKGVSDVRFISDLTGRPKVSLEELRRAGGILTAATARSISSHLREPKS